LLNNPRTFKKYFYTASVAKILSKSKNKSAKYIYDNNPTSLMMIAVHYIVHAIHSLQQSSASRPK
jgi:hypothetical protein